MKYILATLLFLCGAAAQAQTVILQPSPAQSIAGSVISMTAISPGFIIKAAPGNLYQLTSTGTTPSFLMTFNATSVPADGTVAPVDCISTNGLSTATLNFSPGPPEFFSIGIVAALSSTGCFTKTGLTASFFKALFQ